MADACGTTVPLAAAMPIPFAFLIPVDGIADASRLPTSGLSHQICLMNWFSSSFTASPGFENHPQP
jgi:hypothetical protein